MGADPSLEPRTLAETLDDLHARGFTEHFRIVDGGWAWAIDAGRTFRPSQVSIAEWHRFEGVSDPEDMAIVYAIETGSGVRGMTSAPDTSRSTTWPARSR